MKSTSIQEKNNPQSTKC